MYAKPHFTMLAHYNRWAGERLLDALSDMNAEELGKDRGAFFGSIVGTLNHLLVTDDIWLAWIDGTPVPPHALDSVLTEDPAEIRARQADHSQRYITMVKGLTPGDFERIVAYRTISNPRNMAQPLAGVLSHVFNHQTHHRGQIHAMITAARGRDAAPVLDLLAFQRESGHGM